MTHDYKRCMQSIALIVFVPSHVIDYCCSDRSLTACFNRSSVNTIFTPRLSYYRISFSTNIFDDDPTNKITAEISQSAYT